MHATLPEVERIVRDTLNGDVIPQSLVYWWNKTFAEGDVVQAGPQQFTAPFPSTLVFVDRSPKSNWSHPCTYMFIATASDDVRAIEASFPPFMDKPPPEYALILRYGETPADSKDFNPY